MITREDIISIIDGIVSQKNAFIVDVKVSSSNHVTVEIDSNNGITIDDCVEISKLIENSFNRDIEDFELEVSSAGLSSVFKVIQQYDKNIGKEVEVIVKGGKKLTGVLLSVNEKGVVIRSTKTERVEGKKKRQLVVEETPVLFTEIKSTRLVIHFK
jgi:ribosome maturation factor RimP